MGDDTGDRGTDQLIGRRCDCESWRNAYENQQRRQKKAAADTEHARARADCRTEAESDKYVERRLGDWQINIHSCGTMPATLCHRALLCGQHASNWQPTTGAEARKSEHPAASWDLRSQ